ncbi:MAG: Trk system potassium transporter TrkA [Clostridia bacterium]|nr:Trk system potassium transporter TrkA [Clostridia bacterium]
MKIIIVGCGRVGYSLAGKLNADDNDVVVVDVSAEKVAETTAQFDVMGVVGNGATFSVLQEAGIADADLLIAVTNSDELNLLCCMIAKKEGNCKTVARIKDPEYSKEAQYLQKQLDLAAVINPEYEAAKEIARVLRFPSAVRIEPFGEGKVELISIRLGAGNLLVGQSVREIMPKLRANVQFAAVERGDEAYIVHGDTVFEEKDVLTFVSTPKDAVDFLTKIRRKRHAVKDALIVGGGVITRYLCDILGSSVALKIIEKNHDLCEEFASKYPKTTVINANPSDYALLKEQGIEKAEAFVALASLDEENILLSLFAKEWGVKKLVSKINRIDYDGVVAKLDLDTVVCPKNLTADIILRHVRSAKNVHGSNMQNFYNVVQDQVEAAEFIVREGSAVVGKPISELPWKQGVLVASIVRDGKVILPRGNDSILAGDSVIMVTKDVALFDIEDALA